MSLQNISLYSLRKHPAQTFLWADFTAKPDHRYRYKVLPIYGDPTDPTEGKAVLVKINTESEHDKEHTVYFNRGVAASQAYARRFQNRKPEDVPNRAAFKWLSRGLEEAALEFIERASGSQYELCAAVYEFNYDPVIQAFKAARKRGARVYIVYDSRKDQPKKSTVKAIKRNDAENLVWPRKEGKSYIAHNKFIVLLKNGKPVAVWTGSTNFTKGGIFGQFNVGHVVDDPDVAAQFLDYWWGLYDDKTPKEMRVYNEAATPVADTLPRKGTTVLFSPRSSLEALEWYAERLDAARETVALTAAFGVNDTLAQILARDKSYLRYLLVERTGNNYDVYTQDRDVLVSIGSKARGDTMYRWTREALTGYNVHVRYVHTKFMLIDPLGSDPLVISGSANFSEASTKKNDENMLVIRGNKRVADIYLGEFMRLFNHFYVRYHANRMKKRLTGAAKKKAFLREDDSWTDKYYEPGSVKRKQRLLFSRAS